MKKFFLIPAVIALAFISSCTEKEQEIENTLPDEELGSGITEFNATLLTTKTQLGTPTGSEGSREWPNLWSNGDKINVNGVESESLSSGDGYVGTDHAVFTMANPVTGPFYAAYPASAVSGYNAGSATITVPATQTWVDGSYDPAAYIMLGKSDDATLSFTPMMGLVQLTTTAPAEGTLYIKSITVESVGDEKMSGAFTTATDYAGITGGDGTSITISAANGTTFGTVFTFAIPAQNYASGVRFRITANTAADGTGDDKFAVFAKQSAFNVAAGTLYPLTAPEFKESGVTISLVKALTSSSIQIRWDGSNVSNNRNKTWRIHAYTNSACTSEVGSGWTIQKENSSCWDETNSYLTFVIGGLSRNTTYWFKIEDVQNGVWSAVSSSVTTQSFTPVTMPGSITSTGVVLAEDFNELSWGSTVCFRRSAGFRPSNTDSFSNISTDGATFYKWNSEISFRDGALNTALTSSRLNNWRSESKVYAKPGHIKLGESSNAGWILTPEFPVPDNKNAIVNVTIDAALYSTGEQKDYAVAVLKSNLISSGSGNREVVTEFPDVSDTTLYTTVNFSSATSWQSRTAEGLVLSTGDRIIFGRRSGGGNSKPRIYINSITVEVTGFEDLPPVDYVINDKATLKTFLTEASGASVTGRLASNITLTSAEESDLASVYPVANFSGTLYGLNHTISGLTKPLFDDLAGTVDHLVLNSTLNITTDQADLGILANVVSGTVTNCVSKGSVTFNVSGGVTGEHRIGGLIGQAKSGSEVKDCTNEASVTNETANASGNEGELIIGGVLGTFWGAEFSISDCENAGTVTNNADWNKAVSVGGIIGQAGNSKDSSCNLTVEGCTNSGTVSNAGNSDSSNNVGGIIGWMRHGTYIDNTNSGSISNSGEAPNNYMGGLFGYVDTSSKFHTNTNNGEVSNTGVASTANVIGGIVGYIGGNSSNTAQNNTIVDAGGSAKYKFTNSGNIVNSGSAKNIFIGGLFGRNSSGYFNMTGTSSTYSTNSGNITDNSGPAKSAGGDICIGGIAGYTTTGIKTQYARNSGALYVTGDKGNTCVNVGGIGGWISNASFNFNNCRNTGNITVDCTTTSSMYVAGIVGCPKPNSTKHYYWYMNATIDTHAATVSGENYTAGLMGATEGSDASNVFIMIGHKLAGTIWGSKTAAGLFCCTKNATASLDIKWGDETHPCTIAPGTVRKDNTNNNTVNDISGVNIGLLAGGAGSSYDLTSPIDNGYLVVKNW